MVDCGSRAKAENHLQQGHLLGEARLGPFAANSEWQTLGRVGGRRRNQTPTQASVEEELLDCREAS